MKKILCILLAVLMLISSNLSINNSVIYADDIEQEELTINEVSEETNLQTLLDELSLIDIETISDEDIDSIKEKIEQVETIILTLSEEETTLYDFSTYNTLKEYIDNYEIQEPLNDIEEPEGEDIIEEDVEDENNNIENLDDEIEVLSDEERERLSEKLSGISLNYKPDTYPKEGLLHKKQNTQGLLNASPNLPSSYSSKDEGYISGAKYQNPYGTCWAFAAVGAAEANYAKNHNKELIDLSELHLSNYTYITGLCDDPLNLINDDGLIYVYDYDDDGEGYVPCPYDDPITYPDVNRLQMGGNQSIAEQIIGSGVGFTLEENMPYPEDHDEATDVDLKDESYCYHTDYILKETDVFSMTEKNEIKKAIMKYGALAVSYLHRPDSAEDRNDDWLGYYGKDGQSYFGSPDPFEEGETSANHAVTLIGWDDNYSIDHFGWDDGYPVPHSKGAWLLKNSWDTDFGDEGCFYISYEDQSIMASEAFAYVIDEVGDKDYDIYQYDGTGLSLSFYYPGVKTIYEAAVFTAQESEILDYVAVTTMNTGITYQVNVYTNLTDESNPTSGTLVYSKNGSAPLANAGYHTIPIDGEIVFGEDTKFSIVVKLTNPSGNIDIPTDIYTNPDEPLWGFVQSISSEAPNQTFLSVNNMNNFVDQYDEDTELSATMKVKAICHSETHTISFNKNGHAVSSYVPDPYIVNQGDYIGNYYLPSLYDEDYWFVGWDQLLPETMPDHDITLNAVWEERQDVPVDLSVSLDPNDDTIIVSTSDENYLNALMSIYDYRYGGENPIVEVKQSKYLKNDNTTEDAYENFTNRVYYSSGNPQYSNALEKIDSTHVKVSSYEADTLSNGETDITVIAKGYKPFETSVTFTKLIPTCPNDVNASFANGILTVTSANKTWLKSIRSVLLTEINGCDYDQDINIPYYIYEDDMYYINYVDDHLEITIPKSINDQGITKQLLTGHNYRVILSPKSWFSYGYESVKISNSDKVINSLSFNSLTSAVNWTFKCANNKLYIESNNDEWLDELVAGNIGIKFYPSNTYYYSVYIKNDVSYQPIKRENKCVTISDADLKQCGIYKGTYNSIYFDTYTGYSYPNIYDTYQKTYNTYSWQEGFKLTYGKALEKIPTVTLSEGDNGSLNIYSSNEQFLKNIMYIYAVNNNTDSYVTYTYYPYDISNNTDSTEDHITNNTLNIPDMGFDNGYYSFAIGSYGYSTDNLYFYNQFPYTVEFENITLLDLPADADIAKEGDNYYLTSSATAYIDAYDTRNANYQQENEYYKYSPKSFMGFGAAASSYFIDKDFYSKKVTNTKATITSVGKGRTKITVEVPGYKALTKILGEKEYVVHELDGIKVKTVNKKVYLYPSDDSKLTNLLNKISYNNVTQYSLIGFIKYGDNEDEYYDSRNSGDGYIERKDLSTGTDTIGPYLCIDLSDRKFFSNAQYTKEPFFVYLDLNYNVRDNTCGAISFCINRDQYYIYYHDETYNTFMPNTDFPFYYVGKDVTLVDLYNSEYAFDGWYTKDGTDNDWGEKVTSITKLNAASLADNKDDINLYAKWFTTEKNTLSGVTSNINSGEVEKGTVLVLSTNEPNAQIRYTTDSSTPTASSTLYSEPIIINDDIEIKANVFESGKTSPDTPLTLTFTIAAEQDDTGGDPDPSIGLWTSELQDITYDPSLKQFTQPNLKVFHYKTLLTEGKDYTIKYTNNKKVGTATLTVTGKGNYAGTLTKNFNITPIELIGGDDGNTVITLNKNLFTYNGKVQKPSISSVIYTDGNGNTYKLKNNTDYVATIPTTTKDSGDYSVTIQGKGNYHTSTDIEVTYTITQKILASTFSVSGLKNYAYTGDEIKPDTFNPDPIVVKQGKNILVKGTDYEVSYENNTEIGTATMTITGKGAKYEGEIIKTFKITGTAISTCKVTGFNSTYTYDELPVSPTIIVTNKAGTELTKNTDYTLQITGNDAAGTATILITGKGGYTGTLKKTFKITGKPFNAKTITVAGLETAYDFTGSTIEPSITLKDGDASLTNADYEATYKSNINAGTASITFKGKGKYTGSFTVKFKINKINLTSDDFEGLTQDQEVEYSKGGVKPVITSSLVLNKDYSIKYTNNTILNDNSNQKKITSVVLTGKGNYQGTVTIPFRIVQQNINKVTITVPDKAYAFKLNAYKSTPTLTDLDGKKLSAGTDYDKNITYRYRYDTWVDVYDSKYKSYTTKLRSENELVGTNDIVPGGTIIKVTVSGIKNYTGSISTVYKVGWVDISKATVTIPTQYYSGKPICPTQEDIIVKVNNEIVDNGDYYISSYSNNIAKGTASLTIKGKGDLCGEKTVKFTIASLNFGNVIRFYPNGGTGTMKDQIITKDTKLSKNSFKRQGYTFVGWSTDPDASLTEVIEDIFEYSTDNSGKLIKLYAIWQ